MWERLPMLNVEMEKLSDAEREMVKEQPKPSGQDLAMYAWLLGDLIRAGSPILEAFQLTYGAIEQPWLRLLAARHHWLVREGEGLDSGFAPAEMKEAFDSEFVTALREGEETGDLDQMLRQYAAKQLHGSDRTLATTLGRSGDLVRFTTAMRQEMDKGTPLLLALQTEATAAVSAEAAQVVKAIAEEVEGGSSLSEAMNAKGGGALSFDPVYLKIVAWGEIGGVVDILMQYLDEHSKPLAM